MFDGQADTYASRTFSTCELIRGPRDPFLSAEGATRIPRPGQLLISPQVCLKSENQVYFAKSKGVLSQSKIINHLL